MKSINDLWPSHCAIQNSHTKTHNGKLQPSNSKLLLQKNVCPYVANRNTSYDIDKSKHRRGRHCIGIHIFLYYRSVVPIFATFIKILVVNTRVVSCDRLARRILTSIGQKARVSKKSNPSKKVYRWFIASVANRRPLFAGYGVIFFNVQNCNGNSKL